MAQVPCGGLTNIRRHRTEFSSRGDLEPGICRSLISMVFVWLFSVISDIRVRPFPYLNVQSTGYKTPATLYVTKTTVPDTNTH
jgi:hypothetical protein